MASLCMSFILNPNKHYPETHFQSFLKAIEYISISFHAEIIKCFPADVQKSLISYRTEYIDCRVLL